jgi:hypothetical protein
MWGEDADRVVVTEAPPAGLDWHEGSGHMAGAFVHRQAAH